MTYKLIGVKLETYRKLKQMIDLYQYKYDEYDCNISFDKIINLMIEEVEVEWKDK